VKLTLKATFDGVGLAYDRSYVGIYERSADGGSVFLRRAYSSLNQRTPISLEDFRGIADPFSGISNERLLALAFPGLRQIATGSDSDAREWLDMVLQNAGNTPEKKMLVGLMKRP